MHRCFEDDCDRDCQQTWRRSVSLLLAFFRPVTSGGIAATLLAIAAHCAASATAPRPNVLVIIADDMGWGDLSLHGNTAVKTPHLDGLAADGASFRRFYVQPVCAPTRAEFLTGRDHRSVGVTGVSEGSERLNAEVTTIADSFRAAGYATGLFGKWHNGTQPPYHPICRGFEEFYGFTSGHWGHYFDFWLDQNNQMVTGRGYAANDFTEHAKQFIQTHRQQPFFAVVAFNTPHSPMQVPDTWWTRHAEQEIQLRATEPDSEDIPHTRAALAMVENLDWNVGRLLKQLETMGIAQETIVVFFSDNGPNGHRWNGGLRGIKGSTDEGGVRSPLFVRWPAQIPSATRITTPACVLDLPPTLGHLCSVALADPNRLDGLDLSSLLQGRVAEVADRRVIISHWSGQTSARRGSLLLDHEGRLYDLLADPGQHRDLAAERPDIADELAAEMVRREKRIQEVSVPDAKPFTIGHRCHPVSHLPVRDATAQGGVKRSNHYPNCSFFSDWTRPSDAVVWDVEVVTPGAYAVTLFAAVPADAVGSEVCLRADGAECRVVLAAATDYQTLGPAQDRVQRQEGPVKHFRPISMGSLEMHPGRQKLGLSVDSIPSLGPAIWQLSLERIRPQG